MGFNNAKERRKFEAEWKKLREQYREAGFSEESIEAMRDFDEEAYRSHRRFIERTESLPPEDFNEDDYENTYNLKIIFTNLSVTFDESSFGGRYNWIELIDSPVLASRLKKLKKSDLELLTLIGIEGRNQRETARILGCSQNTVSKKLIRLKKFLK